VNNKYAPLKWDGAKLIDENTSEIFGSWFTPNSPDNFIFHYRPSRGRTTSREFGNYEKGKDIIMRDCFFEYGYADDDEEQE
jgi:hypothetical protein